MPATKERFRLGSRSLRALVGVHPDLRRVVEAAILRTEVDFTVLEGLRTAERQRELKVAGASQTLRSRHLTGHAIDVGAMVGGQIRWDWPLYARIAAAMKAAARDLGVALEWGGDWKSFKDGGHFQLAWREYPDDGKEAGGAEAATEIGAATVGAGDAEPDQQAPAGGLLAVLLRALLRWIADLRPGRRAP